MLIAIGSDHAGFFLKKNIIRLIKDLKVEVEVVDVGAFDEKQSDYPEFAQKVAMKVFMGHAQRGIMICGSGIGASIACNKIPTIRAGICHDSYSAHQGVEHDNMNVLVMGARIIGPALAEEIVKTFIGAKFTGAKRHIRRLAKIESLEKDFAKIQKIKEK